MVTNVPKFQCPNALASARPNTDLYFSFLTSLIQSPTYCWFLTLSYQMGKLRPRGPGTVAEQQWEWVFTGLFLPSCCLLSAAPSACGGPPRAEAGAPRPPGHGNTKPQGPSICHLRGLRVHSSG